MVEKGREQGRSCLWVLRGGVQRRREDREVRLSVSRGRGGEVRGVRWEGE